MAILADLATRWSLTVLNKGPENVHILFSYGEVEVEHGHRNTVTFITVATGVCHIRNNRLYLGVALNNGSGRYLQ